MIIWFQSIGTVPAKLLLLLETVFEEGGLRNRNGSFLCKDHLGKINVPVMAIAGDQDLICPPEAVYGSLLFHSTLHWLCVFLVFLSCVSFFSGYGDLSGAETVKIIPEHMVTYKVFGEPKGPHYAHYDLVGGHLVWATFMIPLGYFRLCNTN